MYRVISLLLIIFSLCFIFYYLSHRVEVDGAGEYDSTKIHIEEYTPTEKAFSYLTLTVIGSLIGGSVVYIHKDRKLQKLKKEYDELLKEYNEIKNKPEE